MAARKPVYLDFANGEIIEMAAGDTIDTSVATNVGGGGGAFTDLSDVPASYTGQGTKVVRVNAGETALEFATVAGTGDVVGPGSATANAIVLFDGTTGKLVKDSTKVVADFANASHTHAATDIGAGTVDNTEFGYLNGVTSGIQGQIDGKQASLGFTPENVANKATTYDTVNDTLYPTIQATENRYIPLSSGPGNLAIQLVSNTTQTIADGYGIVIPERYEIGSGLDIIISNNAILEVT